MNLIYELEENSKETKYIKLKNLKVENSKKGMKLQPLEDKNSQCELIKDSKRLFLPQQFKIEFDITEIKGPINLSIGDRKSDKEGNNLYVSTELLDLKNQNNHITIIYDNGTINFKNGSDIKYSKNTDFKEDIIFFIIFDGDNIINKSITIKDMKITTNLPTFCILGTCVSRDLFNGNITKGYKKHFRHERALLRSTIISLMEEPIDFNEEEVIVEAGLGGYSGSTELRTKIGKDDLTNKFLEDLKKIQPEYLIIDTVRDIGEGNLEIDGGKYISYDHRDLRYTTFFENLKIKNRLKITEDEEKFLKIWKERCNLLFSFLNENCPNTTIILNPARHVSRMLKTNGEIIEKKNFKKKANLYNPYKIIVDEYICNNFDVEVLEFDENTLAQEDHKWGMGPLHYTPDYYEKTSKQLKEIVERNRSMKTKEDELLNKKIRQLRKEKIILKNDIYKINKEKNELNIKNNKLNNKLNSVLSSKSWKITKPVRYFMNSLRKFK